MVKAIFLDLDGTLLHLTRDYGDLLREAFETVEGECREEWLTTYDETFFERFEACEPDPCRSAFATVSDDADALAETLLELEVQASAVPDGTHDDLARLGDRFELGVLTNGMPEWQREKLRRNDIARYFDGVVTSYEVGAHKPDPAPFERAEAELPADAYGMVGDADSDVDGAARQGWASVRYEGQPFRDVPGALGWE